MSDVERFIAERFALIEEGIAHERTLSSFAALVDDANRALISPVSDATGSPLQAMATLLKLSNLAIGKYQYQRRHPRLLAHPFGLILECANACQLTCPGCIHGGRSDIPPGAPWEKTLLGNSLADTIIDRHGPFALSTRFFNWGEPLLNPRTPEYIRYARSYMMRTSVSTNLSLRFDERALVASGLDYLILSIDGATQRTYGRYRRGGDLSLVLENVKRLVRAKRALGTATPHLVWQYLLFDHTLEEVELATNLASNLGVNEINFARPYDVSATDPGITIPASLPCNRVLFSYDGQQIALAAQEMMTALNGKIAESYAIPWTRRVDNASFDVPSDSAQGGCQWTYKNIVYSAEGDVYPCCRANYGEQGTIFAPKGDIDANADPFNSSRYRDVRARFATGASPPPLDETCCDRCDHVDSLPNVNNQQIPAYFQIVDTARILPQNVIAMLAQW
ncbi:MAG: hypothetical protein HQK87_00805 [Nitrospinae bacterium]|nr:hypothetical protein [Nitrospinota bacterium]